MKYQHAKLIREMNQNCLDKAICNYKSHFWGKLHCDAWYKKPPVAQLIEAAANYADKHQDRFESRLGDDSFLGPAWVDTILSIRTMLNGELDGMDGGTLDKLLGDMLALEGYNYEGDCVT